ncbi:MAG: HEAT repeat domain-containing protein, partial [Promethearchaeota archaeon]
MENIISPEVIYKGVLNGDLNKNFAIDKLILLIESSDNPSIRSQSIETINKLNLRETNIFKVLESSLLSDENPFVRNSAAKLICKDYLSSGLNSLIWTVQHEKSPLALKTIHEYAHHLRSREFSELIRELDNRLVAISNKVGIIPQESKFILDLESIFTQGDELYELELESYSFFKNLVDHKLKEFWLTISNFHIESLSFNYYNWKYLKDNPGKFNSIAKLNDPNVYFNQFRKLNYIDNLHIEIPQSINLLTNLKKLNIRHNYIKKLPESLFHMKSLQ